MSKERFEQWGYESFKDNKTGEITNDFLGVMNKQDQKISDLETKLAESEESHHKNIIELTKIATEKDRKIEELKQKLEESEEQVKHWHDLYNDRDKQFQSVRQRYHLLNKLQSNYDKKDKLHLAYMQCAELVDENEQLKQQLAEKDEEIISLECVISEIHNDIKELHEFKIGEDEYDLTDSDARFSLQCDLLNNEQDKIEFAIEKLRKAKFDALMLGGLVQGETFFINSEHYRNYIDNQIKLIKGE